MKAEPARRSYGRPPGMAVASADLSDTACRKLAVEAERRGVTPSILAAMILDTVARHNLVNAVLDDGK